MMAVDARADPRIIPSMPKGPRGEKRPADLNQRAAQIVGVATGEVEDKLPERSAAAELGSKGGKARAQKLSKAKRTEIAKKGAAKRWRP